MWLVNEFTVASTTPFSEHATRTIGGDRQTGSANAGELTAGSDSVTSVILPNILS
jgi:hypothetical protein